MRHPTFPLGRAIWMVCACLLLLLPFSTVAETRRPTGLDGGRPHLVTHHRAPSVRGWLSALHDSTVQAWTREHRWFLRACSRISFPSTMTKTHRHGLEDGDAETSDPISSSTFTPLAPFLSPRPRAPDLAASKARSSYSAPAYRSFTPVDSFLPRPPPTRTIV